MPTLVVGTNTYQTRADATTYLDSSLRAALAWPAVDPDSQDRALITAFRIFEREFTLIDPVTGLEVDPAAAPQPVKDAQSELAFELSQNPGSELTANTGSNQKKVKAGSAEVEFFRPTDGDDAPRFSKAVMALIGPYITGGVSGAVGNFASGTECKSSFEGTPATETGLTEGYK